jgi:hypothetical protein
MTETFTWAAGEEEFELTASLRDLQHAEFFDITDGRPGLPLGVGTRTDPTDFFFVDRNTLRWCTDSGPSSDVTIEVVYLATAEELADDADEPALIPPEFRELLAISAAITARDEADEQHPGSWDTRLMQLRMAYLKYLSDRPKTKPSTIESRSRGVRFVEPSVS